MKTQRTPRWDYLSRDFGSLIVSSILPRHVSSSSDVVYSRALLGCCAAANSCGLICAQIRTRLCIQVYLLTALLVTLRC